MAGINDSDTSFAQNTFNEESTELKRTYDCFIDGINIKHEPKYAEVIKGSFFDENDLLIINGCNMHKLINIKSKEENCTLPNNFIEDTTERLQENATQLVISNSSPQKLIHESLINSCHDALNGDNSECNQVGAFEKKDQNYVSTSHEIDLDTKTIDILCSKSILMKNRSNFCCPECSYVTTCASNLEPHVKSHINFKNSSCGGCNFESTPNALRHHRYKCKSYLSKNSLNKDNRNLPPFSCPNCSYVTTCASNLEPHVKSHIDFKNSSCGGCNFESTPNALRHHRYKCESYLSKNSLNKDKRNLSRFSCPECSYVTTCKSNFEPHVKSHIKLKNSSCDGCNFKSTPMALRHHQYKCESYLLKNRLPHRQKNKDNRNIPRFSCPKCSYVTTCTSILEFHIKSHKTSRNSSCGGCNFRSTPMALRYHQYKCESYLLNRFSQCRANKKKRNLSKLSCPKCSFVAMNPSLIKQHVNSHKNFKNSSCGGCNFKSTLHALRFHQYKCAAYLMKNNIPKSKI